MAATETAASTAAAAQAPPAAEGEVRDDSRRILIAIDRSRHSERALRWYAKKLRMPDDHVVFANITEPPEMALGFGMAGAAVAEVYTKAMDETIAEAKKLAADVKAICTSLGIEKIRFLERIAHGPGQAIVEMAEEENADLIVLGSRGMGVIRRTFLGSVSDYVLHHSHRAVAVVPPPPEEEAAKQERRQSKSAEDKEKLVKDVGSVTVGETEKPMET